MRMNTPEDSLGEADFHPPVRTLGIHANPWLTAYTADAGSRSSRFERIPDGQGQIHEKPMNQSPTRPPASIPGNEELKEKWPQYVGAARTAWGEITEDELLQLDNPPQQLATLIHDRYSVTREEADMQVKRFFAKHHF